MILVVMHLFFFLFCKSLSFTLIFLCLTADCRAISMGQGQEIHARKLVGQFMQTVCSLLHSGFRLCKHNTLRSFVVVVVKIVPPGFLFLSLC